MVSQCSEYFFDLILSPCNDGVIIKEGVKMKVRDIAPFGVRMEPAIKEALKKSAKDEGRSLNSEIIQRLIKSLKADGILSA